MKRYTGSYELEHGFKRPSSRLRQRWPGASAFFPDTLSPYAAPAWMSHKMFHDTWMARNLVAQSFWMHGSPLDAPELRGGLYGSGFAR